MTYLAVVIWLLWWCVMASAQPRLSLPKARHAVSGGRARTFGAEMHPGGAPFESVKQVVHVMPHSLHIMACNFFILEGVCVRY